MADIVKIYYSKPVVPDVSRVLACLAEKQVKFESILMNKDGNAPLEYPNLQVKFEHLLIPIIYMLLLLVFIFILFRFLLH